MTKSLMVVTLWVLKPCSREGRGSEKILFQNAMTAATIIRSAWRIAE